MMDAFFFGGGAGFWTRMVYFGVVEISFSSQLVVSDTGLGWTGLL